jgi:NADH-quinone oxidoreductase subunit L
MLGALWLIPGVCLAGALLNLLLGAFRARKGIVTLVGIGSVGAATAMAATAIWEYILLAEPVVVERYFTWISAGSISVEASFLLDPLSVIMIGFVTFVGFLIHVYSVGYMHDESDAGYARYFGYLNLFMFSMLLLVLGSNLPLLFVGWEGVGLCSYLLIGFYFDKDWCAAAGKKAFIVNRIGDLGFLLAIFACIAVFGNAEFVRFLPVVAADGGSAAITLIGLLLFIGAIGKSAQIPLYVWLPDAMAGPTPVSALIHAATMVTAGVYMVARCNVIYRVSPTAMLVVAVVGGLTAIFAATIGLVQNDIKKVLAYSTVSQLGYMFLAAGVGAFVAAIFHVLTHAFFKACLFLGSGSVIHACGGEQDIRRMGGLRRLMPTTYWTFLAATLAITGMPFFAGFFSKDEILAKVFEAGAGNLHDAGRAYWALWGLAVVGALLTALYMFRLVFLTFHGSFRGGTEAEAHLHESPPSMTVPLIVLAALSTVGGLVGIPGKLFHHPEWNLIERFMAPVLLPLGHAGGMHHGPAHGEGHAVSLGVEWALVAVSVMVAAAGIWLAARFYLGGEGNDRVARIARSFSLLHRLLLNKYWVDEIYDALVVHPIHRFAVFCWKVIDELLIDGLFINGTAFTIELGGDLLRFTTSGSVRNYALSVALAAAVLAVLLW